MPSWDEIKRQGEENGDVKTMTKEAHGSGKLGKDVRTEISKRLAGMGLGHVPKELPNFQHEQVRIYKRGTAGGDLVEIVLAPGEYNDRKLSDQFATSDTDYAEIIEQIRELVS